MRYLITTVALIGISLLILLARSLSNTELVSSETFRLLLIFNIVFICALIVLIAIQVIRLLQNIKKEILGSRLTLRLVLSFATVVIIPVSIVYIVSVSFLTKSIESWFNVRVESALQGGLSLGQKTLEILLKDMELKAKSMAYAIGSAEDDSSGKILSDLREKFSIKEAIIYDRESRIISISGGNNSNLPELANQKDLQRGFDGFYGRIEEKGDSIYLKAYVPIPNKKSLRAKRVIELTQPIPESISNIALSVETVFEDYQQLAYSRGSLKIIYTMTLTLVLLLSILSAVAGSFIISRRISLPLSLLAEATKRISIGQYKQKIPENSRDELGQLVKSFNSMTEQLEQATIKSEKDSERLEIAREFLDSILTNLSSGVIVINNLGRIQLHNIAASKILEFKRSKMSGKFIDGNILKNSLYLPVIKKISVLIKTNKTIKEQSIEFKIEQENNEKIIRIQISQNKTKENISYILVIDDITELTKGQRNQAWSDIARRLAHEIKNPLTPIQLSAERIQHKLKNKVDENDLLMLNKSTKTIVNQVDALKTMVNEFSEYSRPTQKIIKEFNVSDLCENIIELYVTSKIKITLNARDKKMMLYADENKIRQIVINLIENSKDALIDIKNPKINISLKDEKKWIILSVSDNGIGIPQEIMGRIFEPYVTSKLTGTGLGLAIVKKIIDEHSGIINFKKNNPNGTIVCIKLPKNQYE